jgi:hypothetical protein
MSQQLFRVRFTLGLLCLLLAAGVRAQEKLGAQPNSTPSKGATPPPAVQQNTTKDTAALQAGSFTISEPTAPASLTVEPAGPLDFKGHDLNTTSDAKKVTLKTTTPVNIARPYVSENFALQGNGCGTAVPVDGCDISISFRPIRTGDLTGTVTITGTDGKTLATIALAGRGFAPADCGLSTGAQSGRDLYFEFRWPLLMALVFFLGIVLVRWNMIAHPTQRLLRAQVDAVEARLGVMSDAGPAGQRKSAISGLLKTARSILDRRASPFDWVFWSRGHEISGWSYVHEAEEQLANLLPAEQVRARLESSQASLRKLNTRVANAVADTIRDVLEVWSRAFSDCGAKVTQQALVFLASQFSLAAQAEQALAQPLPPAAPFKSLPAEVTSSLVSKADELLKAIDDCLTSAQPPSEPRRGALERFRVRLASLVQTVDDRTKKMSAAGAAPSEDVWKAFLQALKDFADARAQLSQGLSDASVAASAAEKPPVERGRAVLQEALHVIYDSTDTELSIYATWHNKAVWLTGCALLLIVALTALLQNGVLFLAGGLGGLLSRLNRELDRADFQTDYGASWATLFLSPAVGALMGWAGVLLVSLLEKFQILGSALHVDWCRPYAPLSLGLAVAFGFSERLFDAVLSQIKDKVSAQKGQASAPPPPTPKITVEKLPDGKVGQNYSVTLTASGGTAQLTWSVKGQLPHPLKLDPSGVISGTPDADGTTSFTVQVTDKAGLSDTKTFTITVAK